MTFTEEKRCIFWGKNSILKWKYHRDFWKDEGKEAFDNYIKKRESEESGAVDESKTGV